MIPYDTSQFDQSQNNINDLYSLIKAHFDTVLVFITDGQADWDEQTITYNVNNDVEQVIYKRKNVTIRKNLTYNQRLLDTKRIYIMGVEGAETDFAFVMGERYGYDADGNIATIEKLTS